MKVHKHSNLFLTVFLSKATLETCEKQNWSIQIISGFCASTSLFCHPGFFSHTWCMRILPLNTLATHSIKTEKHTPPLPREAATT